MIRGLGKEDIIYIAGAISNNPNYLVQFKKAEEKLRSEGYERIINPICVPDNLPYECYAPISIGFVNASTALYVLEGYEGSKGACAEMSYAIMAGKKVVLQYTEEEGDGN